MMQKSKTKYQPGSYRILYFGEFGLPLSNQDTGYSLTETEEIAKAYSAESYVILRVIQNSAEKKAK